MSNPLKKLTDSSLLRFVLVGVLNTLVGTAIMFCLYNIAKCSYWFSSAANYILTSIMSFFLNKYFTFRNKERSLSQVLRFALNIAVCYLLAYGIAKPLVLRFVTDAAALSIVGAVQRIIPSFAMDASSMRENIAMVVGMVLFVIFNYTGQKFFAFGGKGKSIMGRKDGRRIKDVSMMYAIVPYIMEKRFDAMNAITVRVPYQPMQDYIRRKHKEGHNFSHLSLVTAAFVRTVSQHRELNRFIMNKKIYARDGIWVGMVILRPGETESTMTKVRFEPTDTIYDVNDKMMKMIEDNRKAVGSNATDKLMKTLLSIPGLATVGVKLIKWADKHGLLPKSIINASPFHVTMTISNLASIRTNHIHHHVYEFGTTSMLMTMGNSQDIPKKVDGEIVLERQMPLGLVMDERITSGHYFAEAFRTLQRCLKHPELLETPPETIDEEQF